MLADSELQRVRLCKSPRTILITRKSLVVHEFPARVCCGGVFWVSVPGGLVGCGSVWLLHVSLCGYCISRLRFSDMGHMAEFDEQRLCIKFPVRLVKWELKLLQCWNRLCVIRAWAVAELLSSLDVSRMAELRLLMTIDQVGQARQQTPQNYMAPLIFNIGTVYMWAVNITPLSLCPQKLPRSPLNRRVAVPQSGSGRSGEEKMSFPF